MALQIFPALPGVAWNIAKTPIMSTRVMTAASGKEYRAQDWSSPRWKFSLPFQFLRQFGSYSEYTTLQGFILSQGGSFQNFLYNHPSDNTATNQPIGLGTGNQTAFPLVRTIGGFTEPVLAVNTVSSVKVAGVTTAFTLSNTNGYANDTLNFAVAPLLGQAVTATFTFYFVCRFLADENEFGEFMLGRAELKQLVFESCK